LPQAPKSIDSLVFFFPIKGSQQTLRVCGHANQRFAWFFFFQKKKGFECDRREFQALSFLMLKRFFWDETLFFSKEKGSLNPGFDVGNVMSYQTRLQSQVTPNPVNVFF